MINCKDLFLNTHKMSMLTYAFSKLARKYLSRSSSNCEALHADGNEKLQETGHVYIHQQHHGGVHSLSSIKTNG